MKKPEIQPESKKVEVLIESLRERIQSGEIPPGSRLPSVRKLAKMIGVSHGTVHFGLKTMKDEGLLESRPHSGMFVPGKRQTMPSDLRVEASSFKTGVDLVADSIVKDISEGVIRVGAPLPLKKALRFQYKTSARTLKSALAQIEKQGLIHRHGNHLVAGPRRAKRQQSDLKVYRIPARSWVTNHYIYSSPGTRFLYPFERELAESGVSLEKGSETEPVRSRVRRGEYCLGFFYLAGGKEWARTIAGNDQSLMEKEMQRISKFGKRVVLLRMAGIIDQFPEFSLRKFRNIFALDLDNRGAGKDAGKYLGTMGHRKIAFFSYSTDNWCFTRYDGVKRSLRIIHGRESMVMPFHARVNTREAVNLRKSITANIAREIQRDHSLVHKANLQDIIVTARQAIIRDHHHEALRPLFRQALSDPSITAWVAADSTVASAAIFFLRGQGIDVPGKISLLGIHDTEAMLQEGITGLDIQTEHRAYLAAHCLIGDIPIKRNERGAVECPSRIVNRGSVARRVTP